MGVVAHWCPSAETQGLQPPTNHYRLQFIKQASTTYTLFPHLGNENIRSLSVIGLFGGSNEKMYGKRLGTVNAWEISAAPKEPPSWKKRQHLWLSRSQLQIRRSPKPQVISFRKVSLEGNLLDAVTLSYSSSSCGDPNHTYD